jgi:AcrR family transcriptional regulator
VGSRAISTLWCRTSAARRTPDGRLFEAAAAAFAEHGIGGASVEAITAAGG